MDDIVFDRKDNGASFCVKSLSKEKSGNKEVIRIYSVGSVAIFTDFIPFNLSEWIGEIRIISGWNLNFVSILIMVGAHVWNFMNFII